MERYYSNIIEDERIVPSQLFAQTMVVVISTAPVQIINEFIGMLVKNSNS
jgi:hypothetical protein